VLQFLNESSDDVCAVVVISISLIKNASVLMITLRWKRPEYSNVKGVSCFAGPAIGVHIVSLSCTIVLLCPVEEPAKKEAVNRIMQSKTGFPGIPVKGNAPVYV